MRDRSEWPIGVLDSGVGGISVLKEMVRVLPHEDFWYFGDSANAPYGEKTPEEVLALTEKNVRKFIDGGVKAIVIACNTATSAAARQLREQYTDLPIVGVEPALKPATLAFPNGRVLVMATPVTLSLDKYQHLAQRWGSGCEVVSVPCLGLAERIEQGNLEADDVAELVEKLVGSERGKVDCVVLGCTHYPFVRRTIARVLGDIPQFDGAEGTARHLKHLLDEDGLLASRATSGKVTFTSSENTPEELELYRWFFENGETVARG